MLKYLLPLLLLLLAACEATTPISNDMAVFNAGVTQDAATEQARETQVANLQMTATQEAKDTSSQRQADAMSTQAAARLFSINAAITELAIDSAHATATAQPVLATAAAIQTQPALDATATAIAVASNNEMTKEQRERTLNWVIPVAILIASMGIFLFLYRLGDYVIMRLQRKAEIAYTPVRLLIWRRLSVDEWGWVPIDENSEASNLPAKVDHEIITVSPSGTYAVSPMDNNTLERKALKLLHLMDDRERVLPGMRIARMSSYAWQETVAAMRAARLVRKEGDRWVLTRDPKDLRYEFQIGKLTLTPTPRAQSGDD